MVDKIIALLSWIPRELVVMVISAIPIVELRGAIPIGILSFNMKWYTVYLLSIVGNILPIPVVFFVMKYMRRVPLVAKLINPIVKRTERHTETIKKYERIGLMLFVAIPLPWTGVWTGSIVATLLGITLKRAFLFLLAGVIIAGAIVTTLVMLGWIGATIAGIGLCALAILYFWKKRFPPATD